MNRLANIGVDIGGTSIKFGAVDSETGKILLRDSFITKDFETGDDIVEKIAAEAKKIQEACKEKGIEITAIGVGSPGLVNRKKGVVELAKNLPFNNQAIVEPIEQLTGLPSDVANDADAAALGEAIHGAGEEYLNSVMVTLGTGVGGGVIENKKLWRDGAVSPELGHHAIYTGRIARKCACMTPPKGGCWEAYASATALINDIKRAMLANKNSLMCEYYKGSLDNIKPEIAFECAERGDETAKKVIKNYIQYVGAGVANIGTMFVPDAIIIGGGISNQGDRLIKPLQRFTDANVFGHHIDIKRAKFGDDAGIVGAACLVGGNNLNI